MRDVPTLPPIPSPRAALAAGRAFARAAGPWLAANTRRPRTIAAVLLTASATVAAFTVPTLARRVSADPTTDPKPAAHADDKTVTILGSGDIMAHPPTWDQGRKNWAAKHDGDQGGYDFTPMFRKVKAAISGADLAICHLETPLGDGTPQDFPRFRTPVQMADAIKDAGYDACSTASNHVLDQGEPGLYKTLAELDRVGLGHTGSFATEQAQTTPTIYTTKGVKIGHISAAMHFNGLKVPDGKPWIANRIDPAAIAATAKKTREAGAEIVVLSLHWGTEGQNDPDAEQLDWARKVMQSPDIDLVLGAHAHVVQPMEKAGEKWIVYGMGNTLARHDFPVDNNRQGIMPRITFTKTDGKWKATKAEAIPVWLSLRPEVHIVNLSAALAKMSAVDDRRPLYETARQRIVGYANRRGADKAGLTVL